MKKLAIVGSNPASRELAPFNDPSWDLWVFNEAPMSEWCKRWTASFQLHKESIYTGKNTKQPEYWQWLQQEHGIPVYMQTYDARIPDCVVYPLDEVLALSGYQMLGMSVCYAMGLALLQGYEHIEVWGVEMSGTEYAYGGDSWRYLVGYGKGKLGPDHVILHAGEQMFHTLLYGYEGDICIPKKWYQDRAIYLDNTWQAANRHAVNTKKYLLKMIDKQEFEKVKDAIKEFADVLYHAGELAGALTECERYVDNADMPADKNAFEIAIAESNEELRNATVTMNMNAGIVEYIWNVWRQIKSEMAAQQLLSKINELGKAAEMAGAFFGKYTENFGYLQHFDALMEANGAPQPKIQPQIPEMVR